ncbi:MAG: mechanosensitive ion channel family protein [Myxococcales bacterium]|nr:mechanosensitive ion channel family protein [Myxococcales bacterium]MCB9576050.1 mechanosensitive ion channel family protein [Polyangiaceae bacterium]
MNVRRLYMFLCWAVVWLSATSAFAAPPEDCSTPRRATDSVFAWQQPESHDLAKATMCLDPAGRTPHALKESAKHLKAVYDGRALYVNMEDISDEAGYRDPVSGKAVVVPHSGLPDVALELHGKKWVWTRASLDRIDELFEDSSSLLGDSTIEKLPDWLRGSVLGVQTWQYLALLMVLLVGLVLRRTIQFVVQRRVKDLVEKHGQLWASRLVDVFASPGATLLMALLLRVTYPELRLPLTAALAMSVAVRVLVAVSIVWAAYRLVDVFAERMAQKAAATESKLDDQLVPLIRKFLKVFTVVAGVLFVLQNLNVNVASLLAGLGIGGLAVALAAKDTIANFFGSVMIFVDRPFQIGDWVVVDGAEGIIEEVGFRSTRIRTFYNSVITLPNARFMEAKIDNYGARQYRRTFVTLNLTYDTTPEQMQAFVEGVRAIIVANPHTRKDYYEVHMSGFGAHSLDVMLYFFFAVDSWSMELRERHNVYLEIMRLAKDLGVEFAFPTQTLFVDQVAAPGAARKLPEPQPTESMARVVDGYGPEGDRARPSGPRITDGYLAATAPAAQSADDAG